MRASGTAEERVGDEALRRQLGPVEVAARDAGAADVELADRAGRHRLEIGAEHIELRVGDRPPDRDRAVRRVVRPDLVDAAADHRLGRAVLVDEPRRRGEVPPQREVLGAQVLAADDEAPGHADDLVGREGPAEKLEMGRRDLDEGAVLRPPQRGDQVLGAGILGQELDLPAGKQRRVQARDGEVEGDRGVHRHRAAGRDAVGFDRPGEVIDEPAVQDHRALRLAGRARGVHHIGEVRRQRPGGGSLGALFRDRRPIAYRGRRGCRRRPETARAASPASAARARRRRRP